MQIQALNLNPMVEHMNWTLEKKLRKILQINNQIRDSYKEGNFSNNQYRSNFIAMLRVMEDIRPKIRDEHRVRLEKTPFWPLIQAMLDEKLDKAKYRKSDILIQEIIKKHRNDVQAFEIKGQIVSFTTADLKPVFGIVDGDKDIDIDLTKRLRAAIFV